MARASRALALAGGCDTLWVVDHLVNAVPRCVWTPEFIAASRVLKRVHAFGEPWTLLGAQAARNGIRGLHLGVSVTDSSRRHPAVTAQAAATLHLLTRGKARLGIGVGERASNEPYGIDFSKPVGRLAEALATIRVLWDSDGVPVTRDSEWFPLRKAVFDVPAYRGTRPEVWVAAHGPRMLRLTGQYADAWFPLFPQSAVEYRANLATVRGQAGEAGREPGAVRGAGMWLAVVAPTEAVVEELLDTPAMRFLGLWAPAHVWARHGAVHPMGEGFSGVHDFLPESITDLDEARKLAAQVPPGVLRELMLCGTPQQCAEQLAEYAAAGCTHATLVPMAPWGSLTLGTRAMPSFVQLLRRLRRV
jgi:phthiodiolone/phenolphthiodiolone dimycocerosates ketoreductase